MFTTLVEIFVLLFVGYLAVGFLFAIAFVISGVRRVDSTAADGTWGFRLIILPGAMALWPLLAIRWWRASGSPPQEKNAHRRTVRQEDGI